MRADWSQPSADKFDALPGDRIETIDMHAAGEHLRIILSAPFLPQGQTFWPVGVTHKAEVGIDSGAY
jgi:hypothetical protein